MLKRHELSDPNSCLNRAKDDEQTFVLLGRDESAPDAIRAWIDSRIRKGKNKPTDETIIDAENWIVTVLKEQEQRRLKLASELLKRLDSDD